MIGPVRRVVVAASVACAAGCALTAPPVRDVLDGSSEVDCARAVDAFRAAPGDADLALQAAHALFAAADSTVQAALVAAGDALADPDPSAVLAAEADLPDAIRDRVLGLATTGAEAAQAALDALGDDPQRRGARVDADVHLALHLTFVAWANGPMRSLMAGYGSRITAAMDRALALDPEWDGGAPLRLKGRFLAQAPWPLADREQAIALLRRAVATAPLPIHHLFLGDVLWQDGDHERAIAAWRAVLTSEPDDTTRAGAPFHRRMAELRLAGVR
jgi:tetratricopeptide (TPR) repeat protein